MAGDGWRVREEETGRGVRSWEHWLHWEGWPPRWKGPSRSGHCVLVAAGSSGFPAQFSTWHLFSGVFSPGCWVLFTPYSWVLILTFSQIKIFFMIQVPHCTGQRKLCCFISNWTLWPDRVIVFIESPASGTFQKGFPPFVFTQGQKVSSCELRGSGRAGNFLMGCKGRRIFTCPPLPSWSLSLISCHRRFQSVHSGLPKLSERTPKSTGEWVTPNGCLRSEFSQNPVFYFKNC